MVLSLSPYFKLYKIRKPGPNCLMVHKENMVYEIFLFLLYFDNVKVL